MKYAQPLILIGVGVYVIWTQGHDIRWLAIGSVMALGGFILGRNAL